MIHLRVVSPPDITSTLMPELREEPAVMSRRPLASVLEDHLPKSRYNTPGQRVVEGQRLLQAASDIFLGWTRAAQANQYFYWRQLRDMKASALVELMSPLAMTFYAKMCGWTLARAHARSGDPIAIAEYLGADDTIDHAIADFSARYADQNQRDYNAFVKAIADGRIQAITATAQPRSNVPPAEDERADAFTDGEISLSAGHST